MAVLAVLEQQNGCEPLLRWAWDLARDSHESLVVFLIQYGTRVSVEEHSLDDEVDVKTAPLLARTSQVLQMLEGSANTVSVESPIFIKTATVPNPADFLIEEGGRLGVSVAVLQTEHSETNVKSGLAHKLFARAPWSVIALSGSHEMEHKRFLVPVRGGSHGNAALKMAHIVAGRRSGMATALHVCPPTMDEGVAYGQHILSRACAETGVAESEHFDRIVVQAPTVREGIDSAFVERDAIVVGASEKGPLSRSLFGSLSDNISPGGGRRPMVVVRAEQPWQARFTAFFDRLAQYWVPQMDRDTRIGVYEQLESGSRWSFDFMVLMALSTSIAALGLIQSSAAVVIGAMLVAPLMTPLLGAGLSILQSNRILLRQAMRAIGLGFCLALGIGFAVGLLSPIKVLTSELAARGGPTLLDLGVALLAGMAAAYAYARPHLVAALPGVAIAAALVPPIATAGVALSFGELAVSFGAALLFGTNVVAIVLGATFAFYTMGLRGQERLRTWSLRFLSILIAAMLVLSIPLGIYLWQTVRSAPFGLENDIREIVRGHSDFALDGLERVDDALVVKLTGPHEPSKAMAKALSGAAKNKLGWSTRLRTVTRLALLTDSDGTMASEFRRIVEQHKGFLYLGMRLVPDATEVHVAGPDRVDRPFMLPLQREASARGASPIKLVYQLAVMGPTHDELVRALAEALSVDPAYGLRSVRVEGERVHVELDGPKDPSAQLVSELKRAARTRLRKPVGLVLKTHLTSVMTAPP